VTSTASLGSIKAPIHQLWILDVDGTRLVIGGGSFPDTPTQDRADIDEILRSIQIG